MSEQHGWIGVDLDGTLAEYHGWQGVQHIGAPIPAMVARVKAWLAAGKDVRIFTARIGGAGASEEEYMNILAPIANWCQEHLGQMLVVTNVKDYRMVELWDDRCVQVLPNTGERADGAPDAR
jgi:hypothetical protein